MMPILNIGPLAIQLPGLFLILGIWLGLSLAERHAKTYGANSTTLYNLVLVGLVAGAISARLAYISRYPAIFGAAPISLFSLNPGLLDLWGGIAGGLIVALIYGQRKGLHFWQSLDALTPLMAVFSIAIGLFNLASGAAFGAPTQLPWAIYLWGALRHPSQIYETLAAVLILALLWPANKRPNIQPPGVYFLSFIAFSSTARLFLDAFRGDSQTLPGGIRTAQMIAWLLLAACLWRINKLQELYQQGENKTQ